MIGLGIDIVQVARIQQLLACYGDRFRRRCFLVAEVAVAKRRGRQEAATLAARWAAKEALVKALGDAGRQVMLRDIEVVTAPSGQPHLRLYGTAAAAAAAAGARSIHVSLSHERDYAAAVVCLA